MALAPFLRASSRRSRAAPARMHKQYVRAGIRQKQFERTVVDFLRPANLNRRPVSVSVVGGRSISDKSAQWRGGSSVAAMQPAAPITAPAAHGRLALNQPVSYYDVARPQHVRGFAPEAAIQAVLPPDYIERVRLAAIQRGNLSSSSMRIAIDGCQPRPDDAKRVAKHRHSAPRPKMKKDNFIPWC